MTGKCTWPGCARPMHTRRCGLCNLHRLRKKKGTPMDAPARFRGYDGADEGPDSPPIQRDVAGERRRLLDALRDGVPLTLLEERFGLSTATIREAAEAAGIPIAGGRKVRSA